MKNTTIATIFSVACAAVAIYLGCELSNERKASKEKEERYNVDLDAVVEQVSNEVYKGIHDEVVERSIDRAADRKANDILKNGADKAVREVSSKVGTEIARRVNDEWKVVGGTLQDKMIRRVDSCDISKLKEEAVDATRDYMMSQLTDKLDELADKINGKYEERAEKLLDAYEKRIKEKMQYRYGMFF